MIWDGLVLQLYVVVVVAAAAAVVAVVDDAVAAQHACIVHTLM